LLEAAVYFLGLLVGLGVIIVIGELRSRWSFSRRGYDVRRIGRGEYVYEERSAEAQIQHLPMWRAVLESVGLSRPRPPEGRYLVFRGNATGKTMKTSLPSVDHWYQQVPPWARDRRAEIVERIIECFRAWYTNIEIT
jgi:hypothetical protein